MQDLTTFSNGVEAITRNALKWFPVGVTTELSQIEQLLKSQAGNTKELIDSFISQYVSLQTFDASGNETTDNNRAKAVKLSTKAPIQGVYDKLVDYYERRTGIVIKPTELKHSFRFYGSNELAFWFIVRKNLENWELYSGMGTTGQYENAQYHGYSAITRTSSLLNVATDFYSRAYQIQELFGPSNRYHMYFPICYDRLQNRTLYVHISTEVPSLVWSNPTCELYLVDWVNLKAKGFGANITTFTPSDWNATCDLTVSSQYRPSIETSSYPIAHTYNAHVNGNINDDVTISPHDILISGDAEWATVLSVVLKAISTLS